MGPLRDRDGGWPGPAASRPARQDCGPPRGARRLRPYGGRAGGNWNKRPLKRAQKPQLGLCPRSHGEPQARRPAPFSPAAGRRRRDLPARIRRGRLAGAEAGVLPPPQFRGKQGPRVQAPHSNQQRRGESRRRDGWGRTVLRESLVNYPGGAKFRTGTPHHLPAPAEILCGKRQREVEGVGEWRPQDSGHHPGCPVSR